MTELKKIKGKYLKNGLISFIIPKEYIQGCGTFTLDQLGLELEIPEDVFIVEFRKKKEDK